MAKLFLSHSSLDKPFVRKLANDLSREGHEPWLDEWEILVGESITTRVQEGLKDADYVIVVLSPQSVKSGWVDREWQARYGHEIAAGKAIILPVLMEPCELPMMLKDKRYANFHQEYERGLDDLLMALSGVRGPSRQSWMTRELRSAGSAILARVLDPRVPLSVSIAEAMSFASACNAKELASFCSNELQGWPDLRKDGKERLEDGDPNPASHRVMVGYASVTADINTSYFGWGNNLNNAIAHMQRSDDFIEFRIIELDPLSKIEATATSGDWQKSLMTKSYSSRKMFPELNLSEAVRIKVYFHGNSAANILSAVRARVASLLTQALS